MRADDPGQQAFLQHAAVHDHQRQTDAKQRAQRETKQRCRQGYHGMIDEAARRCRRIAENRISKGRDHLVWRRQQRPFCTHSAGYQLRHGVRRLLALETAADQRKVHQHGSDIPDRNQRQHDRDDRRVALDQRMTPQHAGARYRQNERATRHRNAPHEDQRARAARSSGTPASRESPECARAESCNR